MIIVGVLVIVSFSRGFVFIKTRKTAGTSIEMFLSSHCGPHDIVTPNIFEELANGAVAARNFFPQRPEIEDAYRSAVLSGDASQAWRFRNEVKMNGGFYAHIPAKQVRDNVPPEFWDSAFKFTIERHPYEKVVSWAYWGMYRERVGYTTFEDAVELILDQGSHTDLHLYREGERLLVDKIFRHEDLPEAADEICRAIGVRRTEPLPRAKSGIRLDHRPAREILTARQKSIIQKQSAAVFDAMGYEP